MMAIFARLVVGVQIGSTSKSTPTAEKRHFLQTRIQNRKNLAAQSCRNTGNIAVFWTGTN